MRPRIHSGHFDVTANGHSAGPGPGEVVAAVRSCQGGGWGPAGGCAKAWKEPPRRCRRGGEDEGLLSRIPDQGVDVRIGLARSSAEVRIERLGAELRGRDRQRHVLLAGHLTHAQPAGTDLHTLGEDAEVGLIVGRLVGDRHDGDVGTDGEGPELALVVAVVVLGDGSDGSHDANPLACPAEAYSPAGAREIVAGWSLRHPKRRLRRAGTGTQWRTRRRR